MEKSLAQSLAKVRPNMRVEIETNQGFRFFGTVTKVTAAYILVEPESGLAVRDAEEVMIYRDTGRSHLEIFHIVKVL